MKGDEAPDKMIALQVKRKDRYTLVSWLMTFEEVVVGVTVRYNVFYLDLNSIDIGMFVSGRN